MRCHRSWLGSEVFEVGVDRSTHSKDSTEYSEVGAEVGELEAATLDFVQSVRRPRGQPWEREGVT